MDFMENHPLEKMTSLFHHFHSFRLFYLSVISIISLLSILVILFNYIKSTIPVSVNCWFCNVNSKVSRGSENSWYCSHCHQYNGFTEDGDYNKVIPEQYYETLNNIFCERSGKKSLSPTNGLCKNCSASLELKRVQLASFEPLDPNNYDWEIEAYSNLLEKNFKLCSFCDKIVSCTIENQMKSLKIGQLISVAGHKLTSSVRSLNSQSNSIDLASVMKKTKSSLWSSVILSCILIADLPNDSLYQSIFLSKFDELFFFPIWSFKSLLCWHPYVQFILGFCPNSSSLPVIITSGKKIFSSDKNRVILDYFVQFGWIFLFFSEISFVFIKSQSHTKIIQVLILTMIFTISLWKLLYFKYFYRHRSPKKTSNSPKMNMMTPPQATKINVNHKDKLVSKITDDLFSNSDLGIGSLNLGPKHTPVHPVKKNVFSVSGENFPSRRKPLILPSRLNFDLKNETSEINFPLTRSSSQSSGYETIAKSGYESQNSSINGDEDYDVAFKHSSPLQMSNPSNFLSPYMPSQVPSPYELYTYQHFIRFQASFGPAGTHNLSNCSSCSNGPVRSNSNFWFLVCFIAFMILIVQESFILYCLLNR